MATPYLRPIPNSEEKRLSRLEAQVDGLVESVSSVKSDVSSMRASMEGLKEQVSGMHNGFDKIDKSIADLGKPLGSRIGEVEKEQSKWKLKLARASGFVMAAALLIGGLGKQLLGYLTGIF